MFTCMSACCIWIHTILTALESTSFMNQDKLRVSAISERAFMQYLKSIRFEMHCYMKNPRNLINVQFWVNKSPGFLVVY